MSLRYVCVSQLKINMGDIIVTSKSELLEMVKACVNEGIEEFSKKFLTNINEQKPKKESENLFTVKQLAEYWQCHTQTIHKKKKAGLLPFFQHDRKILFRKSDIDKLTSVGSEGKGR